MSDIHASSKEEDFQTSLLLEECRANILPFFDLEIKEKTSAAKNHKELVSKSMSGTKKKALF